MDKVAEQGKRRSESAQTVLRAAKVLHAIGAAQEATFSALKEATEFPNPTLRRLLVSLIETGLVTQDGGSGRYRLGSEAYVLGQLARPAFGIHDLARDSLKRLAEVSADTAFLSVVDGMSTVCLHREEGRFPIRTHVLSVGDRHPLGMGGAGLAILAALPDEEAGRILNANTDVIRSARPEIKIARLENLVKQARPTGVALNPGLVFPGSWAIAAAIRAPSGEIAGALTIAAIESRMTPDRQSELSAPLLAEVRRVERLMDRFGAEGLRLGAAQ